MAYVENGTYEAEGVAASVYRKENGNIILMTEWAIPALKKTIRNWDCMIDGATGAIREKTFNGIKKWSGWDGTSFAWLTANAQNFRVNLVIENVPRNPPAYDDDGRAVMVSKVKWINAIGGGNKETVADESADLDRLFSAKLRANAGVRPVAGVVKPSAPSSTAQKPPEASAPKAEPTTTSTQEAVWGHFCKIADGWQMNEANRNEKWLELVSSIGKASDYDNWTGEDWGKLEAAIDAWDGLPF